MKKIILVFMTALMTISANCQIQNTFFDCVLGKTTYDEAVANLKKMGYEFREEKEGDVSSLTMILCSYKGEDWEGVGLSFYKNEFSSIWFSKMSYDPEPIDESYKMFKTLFISKYNEYYDGEEDHSYGLTFRDISTLTNLNLKKYLSKSNIYTLSLQYYNWPLYDKQMMSRLGY